MSLHPSVPSHAFCAYKHAQNQFLPPSAPLLSMAAIPCMGVRATKVSSAYFRVVTEKSYYAYCMHLSMVGLNGVQEDRDV